MLRQQFKSKIAKNEKIKDKNLEKIKKLANKESEYLERLQNTINKQKEAEGKFGKLTGSKKLKQVGEQE